MAAGAVAVLAAFSLVAQLSIGLSTAAVHARGPALERFIGWQQALSPEAQSGLVTFSDSLDDDGRTDELRIAGDCDALYLNTGDTYEPWTTVQARGEAARIRPGRTAPAGSRAAVPDLRDEGHGAAGGHRGQGAAIRAQRPGR